ncbi:MAG: GNAT family N-acetyltransferase [Lentisphaeria bacterium]|nr:GNAT family N-acetyltransferase [Lentisphaeria bacterium]
MEKKIQIRKALESETLHMLVRSVGWNQKQSDCDLMVGRKCSTAIYALDGENIAGCAAAQLYGNREMAFINMVVVPEQYRRQGIATQMLRYLMEEFKDCKTLRLHASQSGQYVYSKLGFRPGEVFHKYFAPECSGTVSGNISPLTAADMEQASALDAATFGIHRGELLEDFRRMAPELCFKLTDSNGIMTGFIIGREGPHARQGSAVTARCEDDVMKLFYAMAQATGAPRKTLMVVPDSQTLLIGKLLAAGFKKDTPLLSMDYGKDGPAPHGHYYATLGGDFG